MRALLVVETRSLRKTYRLRVVRHATDASRAIVVQPAPSARDAQASPALPCVGLLRPPVLFPAPPVPSPAPVTLAMRRPGPAAPHASELDATSSAPAPEPDAERAAATTKPRRIELSVHALGALGSTAFHLPGHQSIHARQSHGVFGLRTVAYPRDPWWSVETSISGEFPLTPTSHARGDGDNARALVLDGPRLRADLALKGRLLGQGLMPTFGAGIGLQAHYLDARVLASSRNNGLTTDLPFEGVLTLGIGLEYRAGDTLLGIELHVRQGMLPGYRSVGVLLSVGRYLDRGGR
jgi:hypothetical protein